MTAEEMFKELGFYVVEDEGFTKIKGNIHYSNRDNERHYYDYFDIYFSDKKTVRVWHDKFIDYDMESFAGEINLKMLAAINKQVEELKEKGEW